MAIWGLILVSKTFLHIFKTSTDEQVFLDKLSLFVRVYAKFDSIFS